MNVLDSEFKKYVSEALDRLPEFVLKKMSNVAIVIEEKPSLEQRKKLNLRKNEVLFGLYEGVPQTERGSVYQNLPDKITIFKKAIERESKNKEEIKRLIIKTVWHEVAHHFGMDEEEVKREEKVRDF